MDTGAVRAYDCMSHWLPHKVMQYLVVRELRKYQPEGTVLDIGCGPGQLAIFLGKRLPGLKILGLDVNADMIAAARKHGLDTSVGNIDFYLGDVHLLPFEDDSIDLVVSTFSLHHWQNAAVALREIRRVLKPGGRLLLVDLRRDCRRWFYYAMKFIQQFLAPADTRRTNGAVGSIYASYTPGELSGLLASVPFGSARIEAAPGWMLAQAQKVS